MQKISQIQTAVDKIETQPINEKVAENNKILQKIKEDGVNRTFLLLNTIKDQCSPTTAPPPPTTTTTTTTTSTTKGLILKLADEPGGAKSGCAKVSKDFECRRPGDHGGREI